VLKVEREEPGAIHECRQPTQSGTDVVLGSATLSGRGRRHDGGSSARWDAAALALDNYENFIQTDAAINLAFRRGRWSMPKAASGHQHLDYQPDRRLAGVGFALRFTWRATAMERLISRGQSLARATWA